MIAARVPIKAFTKLPNVLDHVDMTLCTCKVERGALIIVTGGEQAIAVHGIQVVYGMQVVFARGLRATETRKHRRSDSIVGMSTQVQKIGPR